MSTSKAPKSKTVSLDKATKLQAEMANGKFVVGFNAKEKKFSLHLVGNESGTFPSTRRIYGIKSSKPKYRSVPEIGVFSDGMNDSTNYIAFDTGCIGRDKDRGGFFESRALSLIKELQAMMVEPSITIKITADGDGCKATVTNEGNPTYTGFKPFTVRAPYYDKLFPKILKRFPDNGYDPLTPQ
jgi:hypothetical protein